MTLILDIVITMLILSYDDVLSHRYNDVLCSRYSDVNASL
jgi:hypothetical protein